MTVVIRGPGKLPCPDQCDVPPGTMIAEVPMPRHNWTDVIICPNEGCGRAWLVLQRPSRETLESQGNDCA